MKNFFVKKLPYIKLVLVLFLACCLIPLFISWVHPDNVTNSTPKVPIYPDSVLVEQDEEFVGEDWDGGYMLTTYHYTSTEHPQDILAFYEKEGAKCDDNHCYSDCPSDTGSYIVYLDSDSLDSYDTEGTTRYRIEITWSWYW